MRFLKNLSSEVCSGTPPPGLSGKRHVHFVPHACRMKIPVAIFHEKFEEAAKGAFDSGHGFLTAGSGPALPARADPCMRPPTAADPGFPHLQPYKGKIPCSAALVSNVFNGTISHVCRI